ncbi:MIP/aquaporin family protein [uncultured Apibacter sp.]|uniref:MIP/aquaporin family protein n=2 Tax=Apibacter TaxID=1778601 RepID=UPI0025DDC0A7|nr:MIP/aquaporin family protein [uncultured Apibacter sp.]
MDTVVITKFIGELLGSFSLIALGCGISMNLNLDKTYGEGNKAALSGPLGWGFAVAMSVIISSPFDTGGQFNPAVTLAQWAAGVLDQKFVLPYITAQFIGCFLGALLVSFVYKGHISATSGDSSKILGVFATNASIRKNNSIQNFAAEAIGTFFLVFIGLSMSSNHGGEIIENTTGIPQFTHSMVGFGSLGALPAGFMIFAIGMAYGGVTGWSLNPARDLMPRLVHQLLPIKGKGSSDWGYGIIYASIAPIVGGLIAAALYVIVKPYFN